MNPIVLYCKSYNRDVDRVKILLDSITKHNIEKIPFYISFPSDDLKLFQSKLGTENYQWVVDEDIVQDKLFSSWNSQQIVKVNFWKLNVCINYVVIDSDSYFIRDFYTHDFLVKDDVPYTVMHEQNDLFSWTIKNSDKLGFDPQTSFSACRVPIMELFGRLGRLYDFGPSPVIWSNKVWKSLEEEYIKSNGLTISNLIGTVASEFTWYGEWLLVNKPIDLWPVEPLFKVFHYLPQYDEYKQRGYTLDHWSRNYLGVVMQSSSNLPMIY